MKLLNQEQVIYICIIIVVILASLHLCKINKNEQFKVLTEEQNIGSNNVLIDSTDNVRFGPTKEDTLTHLLNNKTGNLFVGGNLTMPNDAVVGKLSVSIDSFAVQPTANMVITSKGIQFGGLNSGREVNSAQISAGQHIDDTLCIVGMSSSEDYTTRKIAMWAEGGMIIAGPTTINSPTTINGKLLVGGNIPHKPQINTVIASNGIQFGGINDGRHAFSAQISIGGHGTDNTATKTLAILGMCAVDDNGDGNTRKIEMWAEGGLRINAHFIGVQIHGPVTVSGTLVHHSDKRLKENIKNITQNEKDKILQLVPKTYNFIDDTKKTKHYGIIAQEVELIYPELVKTDKTNGMKSLNYIELIPLLLEQIKELKNLISNKNSINIGGVSLTRDELFKLKQLIN